MANTTDIPPTHLKYWEDTYHFNDEAAVVKFYLAKPEDPTTYVIILDKTIFYPQGGGQPFDQGLIEGANGAKFEVKEVRLSDLAVLHTGRFVDDNKFTEGEKVKLTVDKNRRVFGMLSWLIIQIINAKLHSAGHLVDVALENIGQKQLEPGRGYGYHFPEGAYVEYKGTIAAPDRDKVKVALEEELARLIASGQKVQVVMAQPEEVVQLCGSFPDYLKKDQPARVVTVSGPKGCPCGGTHVKDIAEIGSIKIKKITSKSGGTRISYEVK